MSGVGLGFMGKETRSDPRCSISSLLNAPGGTQGPTMTSRSLPCPCSAMTKDWAGGGRAQGTKNLEDGIGGRESDHDRVVAGMASGLPRTTRDPKAASGGKKIQIQEIRIHSGLRSVKFLLSALEMGLSLPLAPWAT